MESCLFCTRWLDLSQIKPHCRVKGLLNPISIGGGGLDNSLVEVEYRGRQSNVILTTQGESTENILTLERIVKLDIP